MDSERQSIRRASSDDGPLAVSILSDGFALDPVLNWVFGRERDLLPTFFASLTDGAVLACGGTSLGDDCCAVWTAPDNDPWKQDDLAERFTKTMRNALTRPAWDRLSALNSVTERAHPDQPPWCLGMLATRKRSQGHGLGSAMLSHTLAAIDREKRPAYLEATDPGNVAFYQRFGFAVLDVIAPPTAPPITTMWREQAR